MADKLGCYYLVQVTSVNNCLVLLFAATSLTSDRVKSPSGSFFTVLNTFDLEKNTRRGVNFVGGGGGFEVVAFLKRRRNSAYQ